MRSLSFVLFIFLCHKQILMQVDGKGNRDVLLKNIMRGYSSLFDPGNVTLDVSLTLLDLEFDPSSDVLTLSVWERYRWTDKRLAWNPNGGLTDLILPSKLLWTPDIMVYNLYMGWYSRTPVNAIVHYDGEITWVPPSVFKVRCNRNHGKDKTVPMDDNKVITCPIKMGSWTYDGFKVNLTTIQQEISLDSYAINPNLDIVSSEASIKTVLYACCSEPYMSYEATLTLKLKN